MTQKQFCENCDKKFGLTRSQKLCKRCNKDVCSDCLSKKRRVVYKYIDSSLQSKKTCKTCQVDQDAIDQLMKTFYLKWANDSKLTDDWLKSFKIDPTSQLERKYQEALKSKQYENDQSYQQLIDILGRHKEIRDFYKKNYSFFEVISKIHGDKAELEIKNQVKQVCQAFISLYSTSIGFNEGIFDIAVFLLCFCSPCKAFALLCQIQEHVIPSYMYEINKTLGFGVRTGQISNFMQYLKTKLLMEPQNLPKVQKFFEYQLINTMNGLCLTSMQFCTALAVFDTILKAKNKYATLIKIMISLPKIHKQGIIRLGPDNSQIMNLILDFTTINAIQSNINYDLDITPPSLPVSNTKNLIESVQKLQYENNQLSEKNKDLESQTQSAHMKILILANEVERLQKFGPSDPNSTNQSTIDSESYRNTVQAGPSSMTHSSISTGDNEGQKQLEEKFQQQQKEYFDLKGRHLKLEKQYQDLLEKHKTEGAVYEKELLQKNYDDLEKKFVISCEKIMMLGAEVERLYDVNKEMQGMLDLQQNQSEPDSSTHDQYNRTQSMNADEDMKFMAQSVNMNKTSTTIIKKSDNIFKVRITSLEKELERTKKSFQKAETDHLKELEEIKAEYRKVTKIELQNVSDKYAAEKDYLENEWQKQIQISNEWEEKAIRAQSELDRLKNLLKQEQDKVNTLEQQLEEKTKQMNQYKIELEDIKNKSSFNSEQYEELEKFRTQSRQTIQQLTEKLENLEKSNKVTLTKYLLLIIENKRLGQILNEIRNEIKDYKQQFILTNQENEELKQTIEKRDQIINTLEQQIENLTKNIKSSGDQDLMDQLKQMTKDKAGLIKENGRLQLENEQMKIEVSVLQNEIERLRKQIQDLKDENDKNLEELRADYELQMIDEETVQNYEEKIQKLQNELNKNKKAYEDRIKELEEELEKTQKKLEKKREKKKFYKKKCEQLEKELNQLKAELTQLRDQLKVTENDLQRKQQRIKDLEKQIDLLQEQLNELQSEVLRRETKIQEQEKIIRVREEQVKKELEVKQIQLVDNEEQCSLLASELQRIRAEKEDLDVELGMEKEHLESVKMDLTREKAKYNKMLKDKNDKLADQEKIHTQNMMDAQKQINDKIEEMKRQFNEAQNNTSVKTTEIIERNRVEDMTSSIAAIQNQQKQKNEEIKDLQRKLDDAENKLSDYEKEILLLKNKLNQAQEQLKDSQNKYKSDHSQIHDLQQELKNSERKIPELQQKIKDLTQENEDLNMEVQKLNSQKSQVSTQLEFHKEEIKVIQVTKKEIENKYKHELEDQQFKLEKSCREKDALINQLKHQLDEKENIVDNVSEELEGLKKDYEKHVKENNGKDTDIQDMFKRLNEKQAQIKEQQSTITNLKAELLMLKENKGNVAQEKGALVNKMAEQEQELAGARTDMEILSKQLKENQNLLEALKTTLKHKNISLLEAENKCEELQRNYDKVMEKYQLLCSNRQA